MGNLPFVGRLGKTRRSLSVTPGLALLLHEVSVRWSP